MNFKVGDKVLVLPVRVKGTIVGERESCSPNCWAREIQFDTTYLVELDDYGKAPHFIDKKDLIPDPDYEEYPFTLNLDPRGAEKILQEYKAKEKAAREKKKTYKEDFFERIPNAIKNDDGLPCVCAKLIYEDVDCGIHSCSYCWNQVMKDE